MTFTKLLGTTAIVAMTFSGAALAQNDATKKLDTGRSAATAPENTESNPAVETENAATAAVNEGQSESTTEYTFDAADMMSDEDATRFLDQGRSSATVMNKNTLDEMNADVRPGVITLTQLQSTWGEDVEINDTGRDALQAYVDANAMLNGAVKEQGYQAGDVVAVYSQADGNVWVVVDDGAM